MKHSIPHELEHERAREVLEQMLEAYGDQAKQYDVTTRWRDQRTAEVDLCVQGRDIRGTVRVTPECYDLDFDLPWMFRPFQGLIRRTVDEEAQRWLANF